METWDLMKSVVPVLSSKDPLSILPTSFVWSLLIVSRNAWPYRRHASGLIEGGRYTLNMDLPKELQKIKRSKEKAASTCLLRFPLREWHYRYCCLLVPADFNFQHRLKNSDTWDLPTFMV